MQCRLESKLLRKIISGHSTDAEDECFELWGWTSKSARCVIISFRPRKARFHLGPQRGVGWDFRREPREEGAQLLRRSPARITQGPVSGGAQGARVASSSPLWRLPASSRPGSGASLPWGASRIAAGAPDFLVGAGRWGWRRQGAASPSSFPLSAAWGRSDRATRLGAAPETRRRAAPTWFSAAWLSHAGPGTRELREVRGEGEGRQVGEHRAETRETPR